MFNTFHSQRFIDWAQEQFASSWQQSGCRIDLSRARYVPYREERIDKERTTLRRIEHEPHELWVQFTSYDQIRQLCRAEVAHDTAFFFDYDPYRRPGRGTLLAFRTDPEAATEGVPPGNREISVACESLDEFLRAIARHEVVKTDHAHVMIAAALLGKEVHYAPSNYHKLPGLVSSSLHDYPVFPLTGVRALGLTTVRSRHCPAMSGARMRLRIMMM